MLSEDLTLLTTSKIPQLNGIAFPIIEGTGGFFTKTEGAETLMSSLKQLILTSKGERVMNPEFGTSLRKSIFEPFTKELELEIKNEIVTAIKIYEPLVNIKSLQISWDERPASEGRNQVYVSLLFTVEGTALDIQTLEIVV